MRYIFMRKEAVIVLENVYHGFGGGTMVPAVQGGSDTQ
jgi:hypothetical protein